MWINCFMSVWRKHSIRTVIAVFALIGALLHTAAIPFHGIMQAGAAAALGTAADGNRDSWAVQAGATICHGAQSLADGGPSEPAQPISPGSNCPVCLASMWAVASVDHVPVTAPAAVIVAKPIVLSETPPAQRRPGSSFDARGPPALI